MLFPVTAADYRMCGLKDSQSLWMLSRVIEIDEWVDELIQIAHQGKISSQSIEDWLQPVKSRQPTENESEQLLTCFTLADQLRSETALSASVIQPFFVLPIEKVMLIKKENKLVFGFYPEASLSGKKPPNNKTEPIFWIQLEFDRPSRDFNFDWSATLPPYHGRSLAYVPTMFDIILAFAPQLKSLVDQKQKPSRVVNGQANGHTPSKSLPGTPLTEDEKKSLRDNQPKAQKSITDSGNVKTEEETTNIIDILDNKKEVWQLCGQFGLDSENKHRIYQKIINFIETTGRLKPRLEKLTDIGESVYKFRIGKIRVIVYQKQGEVGRRLWYVLDIDLRKDVYSGDYTERIRQKIKNLFIGE